MNHKLIQKILVACLFTVACVARAQDTNTNTNRVTATVVPAAPVTNSYAANDFRSFELITKRNIFDPTRSGSRSPRNFTRPPRVDFFTLVGTMSDERGPLALFVGTSSEYRKTLKPADKIAGYKIQQIAYDHITLAAASNQTINLPVGTGMRRQEGGAWKKSGGDDSDSSSFSTITVPSPTDSSAAPAAPAMTGGESDAMKRLMLKRLSEK